MHRMNFLIDALKNRANKWNKRETEGGQSIVILVLGLIGLIAFAGLVFDGGTAFAQFRRMQNAADAGALAGAQELSKMNTPDGVTNGQICSVVVAYSHDLNAKVKDPDWQTDANVQVQYILPDPTDPLKYKLKPVPGCHVNGAGEGTPAGPPPATAKGVRVTVSTTFKTFFLGGLMGLGAGTSTAHSSAEYGPASPINVQPLAKRCPDTDPPCDLRIGVYQRIWEADEPGNLGWLGFNGDVNTPNLKEEFNPDLPPKPYIDDVCMVDYVPRTPCKNIGLGCWVQGTTGDVSAIQGDLERDWQYKDRPLIIVLYDRILERDPGSGTISSGGTSCTGPGGGGGSNAEFHIVGFAAFQLGAFDLAGGVKYMEGTFVRWMDSSAICKDCADTGLYSVHLIPDVVEPPPPPGAKGRICVTVGYDVANYNTFEDGVDYYLAGATVDIKNSSGTTLKSWTTLGSATNCTDAIFDPGTYTVMETNPLGYVSIDLISPTYTNGADTRSVTVTAGGTTHVLFLDYWADTGNIVVLTRDADGNVLPSLAAVLKLASDLSPRGGPTKSVTGTVYFSKRPPEVYIISGVPAPGYDMVNVPPYTYNNITVTLTAGSTITRTIVAKKYAVGKICVTAWDDSSGATPNGVLDPGERSLWGALITVAGTQNDTHTMGDGEYTYCFENLRLGPYTVSIQHPPGYSAVPGTPDSYAFELTEAGRDLTFRDVIPPRGNICVVVFDDITGNGIADPGEVNIGGGVINFYKKGDSAPLVTYTTNGTEPKCFSVLTGTYNVQGYRPPTGYLWTTPDWRYDVVIAKDMAVTISFGAQTHEATKTPTITKTPTPTKTNTPPPNTTPTPTPTPTNTPVPGDLCVRVYEDLNSSGTRDAVVVDPTPTGTPTIVLEPEIPPKNVTIMDAGGKTVGTWDGTGAQPKCWNNVWSGDYSSIETDAPGYASTTANLMSISVFPQASTIAEYGDKLCFAMPPHMRDPIFKTGNTWYLQWDNLPGTFYTIYASDNSINPEVPSWTVIARITDLNYLVERNQGTYFYVTATDNCGTSGPSNVVSIGVPLPTPTPTPTATPT